MTDRGEEEIFAITARSKLRDIEEFDRGIIDMVADGYPHTVYESNDKQVQALIDETWRRMDEIYTDALYGGTNVEHISDVPEIKEVLELCDGSSPIGATDVDDISGAQS